MIAVIGCDSRLRYVPAFQADVESSGTRLASVDSTGGWPLARRGRRSKGTPPVGGATCWVSTIGRVAAGASCTNSRPGSRSSRASPRGRCSRRLRARWSKQEPQFESPESSVSPSYIDAHSTLSREPGQVIGTRRKRTNPVAHQRKDASTASLASPEIPLHPT